MSAVTDALFYALETADLKTAAPILLMLPDDSKISARFPAAQIWHPSADQASQWASRGHVVVDDIKEKYKTIILWAPKQKDETLYAMACALKALDSDGRLLVAADNQAGGKTLDKQLSTLIGGTQNISKHKCRVVWTTTLENLNQKAVEAAVTAGSVRQRPDDFHTQPGLFSWKQLDKGTNVLLHHLPFSFAGTGADFGCGIGILGARLLQRHSAIKTLYCIDNDHRAIRCARMNLSEWQERCNFLWADVRDLPSLPPFDFIVMNPPFHQGKMDSNLLGHNFITSAAAHLRTGGMLVFVANTHLPYEAVVGQHFSMQRKVAEQDGFKIIEAVK